MRLLLKTGWRNGAPLVLPVMTRAKRQFVELGENPKRSEREKDSLFPPKIECAATCTCKQCGAGPRGGHATADIDVTPTWPRASAEEYYSFFDTKWRPKREQSPTSSDSGTAFEFHPGDPRR